MRKLIMNVLTLTLTPVIGVAHHNVANRYDSTRSVEIEGIVTDVLWRNPHIQVNIQVAGEFEARELASTALSNIRRWQIAPNFIEVGDTIRVAGSPERSGTGVYITHVLTMDGEEVLLDPRAEPRWSDRIIEMAESRRARIGDSDAPDLGIFRVWSTPDGIPMLIPEDVSPSFDIQANYPLTEAAIAAVRSFDRERDNPIANCQPKGMPTIMEAPYPHRFVRDGENILWHQEEYDTLRTIHMSPDANAEGMPASLLGYSVGRWEDDRTLVVTTTNTTWRHFDTVGIPLSEDVVLEERFVVAQDGSRLDYTMTVTDPVTFMEPVVLRKHWLYFSDAQVGQYQCLAAAEN